MTKTETIKQAGKKLGLPVINIPVLDAQFDIMTDDEFEFVLKSERICKKVWRFSQG